MYACFTVSYKLQSTFGIQMAQLVRLSILLCNVFSSEDAVQVLFSTAVKHRYRPILSTAVVIGFVFFNSLFSYFIKFSLNTFSLIVVKYIK